MTPKNGVRSGAVKAALFLAIIVSLFSSVGFTGTSHAEGTLGIEGLKIYGDGRARFEQDDRTRLNAGVYEDQKRDRFRYRLRVGFTYTPVEAVEMGARVTSGDTSDANSPHVILGSNNNSDSGTPGFSRDSIGIDRFYIKGKYKMDNIDGFAWFGKETMPLWTQNEYFWDADINPEGIAAGVSVKDLGPITLTLQGGYFIVAEGGWSSTGDKDSDMIVYQGVVKASFAPVDLTASYGLLKTDAGTSIRFQNPVITTKNDYSVTSAQAKIKAIPDVGITLGYDYFKSNVSTLDKGSVISAGGSYKDFSAAVLRPDIETNAVTGFAQDNFPNYFSNFKGYEYKIGYKFTKNINADIVRFDGERKSDSKQQEKRTQLNVNVSF